MTIGYRYYVEGKLFYSTDLINWILIPPYTTGAFGGSKIIYMVGKINEPRLFYNNAGNRWTFNNGTNVSIEGNLNTLLDYENPPTTILVRCFATMFTANQSLTSISKLELPATTIHQESYFNMFQECRNLIVNTASSSGYSRPFRIPSSGTGNTVGSSSLDGMFSSTAGTMNGTPSINTTYYVKD